MSGWQLAVTIGGLVVIAVGAMLIRGEVRSQRNSVVTIFREAWAEAEAECGKAYLPANCRHPFPDRWPDGRVICYGCGRQVG